MRNNKSNLGGAGPRVAVGPGARARLATRLSLRASGSTRAALAGYALDGPRRFIDAIDYFQKYDHSLSVGSHTWVYDMRCPVTV